MIKLSLLVVVAFLVCLATALFSSIDAFSLTPAQKQSFLKRHHKNRQGLQYEALNGHKHHRQRRLQPEQKRLTDSSSSNRIMGGWMGLNGNFFSVANPLFNTLLKDELTGFVYSEYNTSELGVHIYLNNITVVAFNCNECVTLGLANSYMTLALNQFSMNLALSYEAKAFFFSTSGTCTPQVDNLNLTAEIAFAQPVNGKPQVAISNINLQVDTLQLNCQGSIMSHFANAMADLFKFFLSDLMDDMLNIFVTHEVNKYLSGMELTFNLDNYSMVNFNLIPSQSYITNRDLSIGVAGIVTPIANPNMTFPFPPPSNLKSQCFGGGMVNVGLSLYSMQTAIYTFFIGGKLAATFPGAIKASDLVFIIPGFYTQLGAGALLDLGFAVTQFDANSMQFDPAQGQILVNIVLNISITGAQNTSFVMQVSGYASLSLSASGGTNPVINFQIPNLSLSNPQVLSTNVGGQLSAPLVVTLIDGILYTVVLGPINKKLANGGIPLPTVDGFQAQNPNLIFNNNSVCVAMNVAPVS